MPDGDPLDRFRQFYEQLSPAWLERLPELYAPNFQFRDAFHQFDGDFGALRTYLERMLGALAETRFLVDDIATGSDGSYVRWRWEWRRRTTQPLRTAVGVTHLRFDRDGRITHHADLFDAAEGFYETLPIIGWILRAIKKRL